MITKEKKQQVLQEYAQSANDTGSSVVQIALLTKRIEEISGHLKSHKHDNAGRFGLIKMVGQRRAHLRYLAKTKPDLYGQVMQKLGIRK